MPERERTFPGLKGKRTIRELVILTLGAGLYAGAMPGSWKGIWWFSYIALVPLFFCLDENRTHYRCALYGLYFGSLSYFFLLKWVEHPLAVYANLGPLIGYLAAILLSLYCGIYVSIFSWALSCSWKRYGDRALMGVPFLWCGIEIFRLNWDLGFPWMLIGYSQYFDKYARLFSAWGGVMGTGFVIVAINVLFYLFLKRVLQYKFRGGSVFLFAFLVMLVLLHIPGMVKSGHGKKQEKESMRMAIIQPNIDQWNKWDIEFQGETIQTLDRLSKATLEEDVEVIVWPETALPFFYYRDEILTEKVERLVEGYQRPLITGVPWYDEDGKGKYFNAIVILIPRKNLKGRYDKIKLVPFGEFVPFRKILFFIDKIVEVGDDFSSGEKVELLVWKELKAVPSVCYEAIYPELSRSGVKEGGNLLINLTNDAWFGRTMAPYQQLYMAAFRSVETGRYMIRCSNSGVSAVIDEEGDISHETGLFQEAAFVSSIPLLGEMTFFVNNATLINLFILSGALMMIFSIFIRRK